MSGASGSSEGIVGGGSPAQGGSGPRMLRFPRFKAWERERGEHGDLGLGGIDEYRPMVEAVLRRRRLGSNDEVARVLGRERAREKRLGGFLVLPRSSGPNSPQWRGGERG